MALFSVVILIMHVVAVNGDHQKQRSYNMSVSIIGGVVDYRSRVGKEQKLAMEMAVHDFHSSSSSTASRLDLLPKDSHGSSARAASSVINMMKKTQIEAIVGTLTTQEAALFQEIDETTSNDMPVISLTSPAISPPTILPGLFRMADTVTVHMQCIAAIVGHFRWPKVTAIFEHYNGFKYSSGLVTVLSDSLRPINSQVETHLAFPSLSSESYIEERLKELRSKSNRVFIVAHSSLELAMVLFKKADRLGMMQSGYVWIVTNEIASLLDSVPFSVINNMQGVLGFKTYFPSTRRSFQNFKTKFRRNYGVQYPEEEEKSSPSIFALQAYDAIWAIGHAMEKSEKQNKNKSKPLSENILSSDFNGLSGRIRYENGRLSRSSTFQIINVVGRSYREVAFWSPVFGFSEKLIKHEKMKGKFGSLEGKVYWPGGGMQQTPKGWNCSSEKRLKIGVPANGAFKQFVKTSYDHDRNETQASGFSVDVFESVLKFLPYYLPREFVSFDGIYDDMVHQVYNETFDAAIGDIQINSDRNQHVQFTQPYIESGLTMVVPLKSDRANEKWMFMEAFTPKMWFILTTMHVLVGLVIWSIEHADNPHFEGFGSVIWFSTMLFFVQREAVKNNLARIVLAPWLFVILIVAACFTATLASMLTISGYPPSKLDMETLVRTDAPVGCNRNSFIGKYLVHVKGFKPENIKHYNSIDEYPDAFMRGHIVAAFLTSPHAQVLSAKYCKRFTTVGAALKLGGLGFVFRKGSPLAFDVSEAILKATESGKIEALQSQMLRSYNCTSSTEIDGNYPKLGHEPFSGLFIISGTISAFAFILTVASTLGKRVHDFGCIQIQSVSTRARECGLVFTDKCFRFGHLQSSTIISPSVEESVQSEELHDIEQIGNVVPT